MKKYFDLICIITFLFLVVIFFYPTILLGKLPVPSDSLVGLYHPWRDLYAKDYPRGIPFKNFLITDPVRQQIPWRKIAIDQLKSGGLPVWNQFNFAGTPLAANIQSAVFYPFNLLFLVISFPSAWTLLIILEPLLGGLFLYLYLRQLRIQQLVALAGSVIWSFCGFNISWLTWGTITHAALWLPAILLALERIFVSKKILNTVVWSVFLIIFASLTFFAGHAQVALYVYILCFIYAVWKIFPKFRTCTALVLGLSLLGIILITSVQWLPLHNLLNASSRVTAADYLKAGWFLPWQNLIQFIAPDFFGNPATLNYWGIWNYGEFIGYLGIVPLIFIVYGLISKKNSQIIFWLSAAIISLVFMLPSFISKLPFVLNLPLISTLQPTRLMIILDFSLVMLAVYGLSSWLENKERNHKLWVAVAAVVLPLFILWTTVLGEHLLYRNQEILANLLVSRSNLVLPTIIFFVSLLILYAGWLFRKISKGKILILLLFLTVFDLFRFGWKFTPFTDSKYFFPETKAISFLRSRQGPFRIMSVDKEILPPNTASYYGLESVEGYDPIFSQRYEEFIAASERGKPDIRPPYGFNRIITLQNLDSKILPLLNVKYILSLSELNKPYLKKVYKEGETRIYEDSRAYPRAFFVNKVVNETIKQQIIEDLYNPLYDLKNTAIVENPVLFKLPVSENSGKVIADRYTGDSMFLSAELPVSQYLVISGSYNGCWKAEIDGSQTQIYRTDFTLMGLIVPAGMHKIVVKCDSLL